MAKADLILKSDLAFGAQMKTFKNNIVPVAASLGVTPAQVAAQAAEADYFNYVLACQNLMLAHSTAWKATKKLARNGSLTGESQGLGDPVLPDPVPLVRRAWSAGSARRCGRSRPVPIIPHPPAKGWASRR